VLAGTAFAMQDAEDPRDGLGPLANLTDTSERMHVPAPLLFETLVDSQRWCLQTREMRPRAYGTRRGMPASRGPTAW
jgi:hypothetical protein